MVVNQFTRFNQSYITSLPPEYALMGPLYKILPVNRMDNSWNRKCVCHSSDHIISIFMHVQQLHCVRKPKTLLLSQPSGVLEWRADVGNSWYVIVACEMQLVNVPVIRQVSSTNMVIEQRTWPDLWLCRCNYLTVFIWGVYSGRMCH